VRNHQAQIRILTIDDHSLLRKAIAAACLLFFTSLAHGGVLAPSRDRALFELHHSSWTVTDGAPGDINVLAQTTDGYIWLGTGTGLYRFDGMDFERYAPLDHKFPARIVESLYATPDNGLLVGFRDAGASFIENGRVSTYPVADGLEMGTVRSFAITRDGVIWAAAYYGLFRLVDSRWTRIEADWQYPWRKAQTLFVDRAGTLWVAGTDSVVFLRLGEKQFQRTAEHVTHPFEVNRILQAPDGTIWVGETSYSVRPLAIQRSSVAGHRPEIIVGSYGVIFDDAGCLWIASLGDGVGRVRFPERLKNSRMFQEGAEIFSDRNGLTANYATAVLEDREGNIWVGTSAGLDRFQSSNVVLSPFPSKVNDMVLIAGDHGDIWTGSLNWAFSHLEGAEVTRPWKPNDRVMACGIRDAEGTFWLGEPFGLTHLVNGRFYDIALPKEITTTWITALAEDKSGVLWVVIARGGLFRLINGAWSKISSKAGLPEDLPTNLYADAEGRIWLEYLHGRLAVFDNGRIRMFNASNGITVGDVTVVYEHHLNIWIGGETGLELYREGRFHRIIATRNTALWRITGIVETDKGDLWLNTAGGVVHIDQSELARSLQDDSYPIASRQFDYLDGLPGTSAMMRARPTAVQGTDGRIWFSVSKGIVWIDPAHILKNSIPPPVYISSIAANGKEYPSQSELEFPARTRNIRISYTGLSYRVPERVRFRYRLEGMESDWQDPGTRREAFYTNLRPGNYRFRVIASNDDNVWNETGATLNFTVAPAWFQTSWFRALCVGMFGLLVWAIYQLRVQRLHRRFAIGLEARVNERTRIARELHDTLLQSLHGLMFQFQAARNLLPLRPNEAMRSLDEAINETEKALAESRDAIQGLRSEPIAKGNLAELLKASSLDLANSENANHPAPIFNLIEEGKRQTLSPMAKNEICRIALEILRNAYRHANARGIEVEVRYGDDVLRLRIRDDGEGIDPRVLQQGATAGHWGLRGVRERAERIGAQLEFWSEAGAGTEVQLTVPAAVAYETSRESGWSKIVLKKAGNRGCRP
jgi:signal transduction histidine kinase/ligand-binding sensor domain-containing protein